MQFISVDISNIHYMENDQFKLPENAQRELKPGEEYEPILSKNKKYQEITVWSVCIGLLMTILFSAAAAYLGLKVGQVFEAAIPIAIIAIGLTGLARKNDALSQNVIIQSIGGCSGGVVAGAIFTLPALYILQGKGYQIEINFSASWAFCSSSPSANTLSRSNTASSPSLKPQPPLRSWSAGRRKAKIPCCWLSAV